MSSNDLRRRRLVRGWLVISCWALPPALAVGLVLGAIGAGARWATLTGTVAGLLGAIGYARKRTDLTRRRLRRPLAVDSLTDAEKIEADTRQTAVDPTMPAADRTIERLNRARALMLLAVREDSTDRVQEALALLRQALDDPLLDPLLALAAADDLVNAESSMAQRSGDDHRYAQAIALFAQVVRENPALPGGRVKLHGHRAEHLAFQACRVSEDETQAERDGDPAAQSAAHHRLRALMRDSERERRAGIALARPGSAVWAQENSLLGLLLCNSVETGGPDRTDEGVVLVRQALDRQIELSPQVRRLTEMQLAQALLMRLGQRGDQQDRAEATRILNPLTHAGPPLEGHARELLLLADGLG